MARKSRVIRRSNNRRSNNRRSNNRLRKTKRKKLMTGGSGDFVKSGDRPTTPQGTVSKYVNTCVTDGNGHYSIESIRWCSNKLAMCLSQDGGWLSTIDDSDPAGKYLLITTIKNLYEKISGLIKPTSTTTTTKPATTTAKPATTAAKPAPSTEELRKIMRDARSATPEEADRILAEAKKLPRAPSSMNTNPDMYG